MSTLKIYKAQGIGDRRVEALAIVAEEEIPNINDLEKSWRVYANQAKCIADAIFKALPGGTVDALLVEMLTRKASLLVIPHVLADVSEELVR